MAVRVFVADDDASVRRMLRRYLEGKGHTVEAFEDGPTLVAACLSGKPDIVLCDVEMPGPWGGIEACLRLRQRNCRALLVLMTGDAARAEEARETGFEAVLMKPFMLTEVEDAFHLTGQAG